MLKPTLDALLGLSNEQLFALSDAELDTYLAEALTVQPKSEAVSRSDMPGRTTLNTRPAAYKGSSRVNSRKGPSELAEELAQSAIDNEVDAEVAALEAQIRAEALAKRNKTVK